MTTQTAAVTFASLTTKKAKIAFVREALATSQAWAQRGLIRIFENQTADEQASATVSHDNGIGFTGVDAEFLTSLAKQLQSGKTLSPKQMVWVHKKMPKYAKQLVESIAPAAPVAVDAPVSDYANLVADTINFINKEAYMPHVATSNIGALTAMVINMHETASLTSFNEALAIAVVKSADHVELKHYAVLSKCEFLVALCHDKTVNGYNETAKRFDIITGADMVAAVKDQPIK